ncbi:MAG: phosphomannose isomerase type II C-terminal cupin domain [Candidatus Pacearchaeota archaeon]|nr:phosphomannose isomerase type II C-terminal cupin domain [Candidatus Pacearchaeota archaeon]
MKEVRKPWGFFREFALNEKCTVKMITLNPGQELSLQRHKKRDESWYFLSSGVVQLGNRKFKVKKNQLIKIKRKMPHRALAEKEKVEFLEISKGKFSESDEIRLEDKYGR